MYHFYRIYDARKTLSDYTNLFYPNTYQKNGKVIYNISTLKTNMEEENVRWNKELSFRWNKT